MRPDAPRRAAQPPDGSTDQRLDRPYRPAEGPGQPWSTEPDRPAQVRLSPRARRMEMLWGRPGQGDGLQHGWGNEAAFPPGWRSTDIFRAIHDVARNPEQGLGRCGRDNPADTDDCRPDGGCWIATGDRPNPHAGGDPVAIAVHIESDGLINSAWTLPEIDGRKP